MMIFALVLAVAAIILGGLVTVLLFRGRRYMMATLVAVSTVLLGVYAFSMDAETATATHSPEYFAYAIGFLALFGTLYPAIPRDELRERLRIYFLVGLIGVLVLLGNLALENTGLPVLLASLALILAVMVSYTVGTMWAGSYGRKKRKRACGVRYATWGAVALSHLLYYPAIGLLFAGPNYCSHEAALLIFLSVSLILATLASLGVRTEGDYWQVLEKKPSSVVTSSAHLVAAITYRPRKHRLV